VFIQNLVCIEPRNTPNTRNGGIELVKSVDEAVEKLREKKRIIWMGRLRDALKRPALAIEVFAKLVCELMSGGVEELPTLTMLGACDKATEKRLRKLFNSLTPSLLHASTITFLGFVTDVGEYLAKADVHLFTSATEVTIPQVVLEARTAGVETVAFDMPVLREVIEPQNTLNARKEEEKWRLVLDGGECECDFDTPEVRQLLMDEMHRSQQWFTMYHLPELQQFRVLRQRLNLRYIVKRIIERAIRLVKSK
jgi:glycosyltransferase involved in cell wall biosynthesis